MYFQSEKDMLCTTEYRLCLPPCAPYTASPLSSLKTRTRYQTENKAEHYKTCVVFSSFHFNLKAIHAYSFFSVRAGRENKRTIKKKKKNSHKIPHGTCFSGIARTKMLLFCYQLPVQWEEVLWTDSHFPSVLSACTSRIYESMICGGTPSINSLKNESPPTNKKNR